MGALAKSLSFLPLSAHFLETLLADYPRRDFQVRLWDGTTWGAEKQPRFALILKHPEALRAMFIEPSELKLGEAYIYDDFDVEGDIEAAFDFADQLFEPGHNRSKGLHLAQWLQKLPVSNRSRSSAKRAQFLGAVHSKERDRQAVSYHYDLPADFYALWLDQRMVYSCAYFATPEEDLDSAQERKLDYICRKLRLRRGERLLDIGCGWGGLIKHAVAHYGVEAVGITLSVPQAEVDHPSCGRGNAAGSGNAGHASDAALRLLGRSPAEPAEPREHPYRRAGSDALPPGRAFRADPG